MNPKTSHLSATVCGALLLGALFASSAHGEDVEVKPGEQLVLDLEPGGAVDISTWDRDLLRVNADFRGPDSEQVQFDVSRTPHGVRIRRLK